MHSFAVAYGLDQAGEDRLLAGLASLGEEFRLDPATAWQRRSRSRALVAAGVQHAQDAVGARRYVVGDDDHVTLFDGLPLDVDEEFHAHDAGELSRRWPALPERLEGQFVAARIDLADDRVEVLTDPLAILPLFWSSAGSALVIGTSATLVASVLGRGELDPLAVASSVALGWAVEHRTVFDGVRALDGGSLHRFDRGRLRSVRHFGSATVAAAARRGGSRSELAESLVRLSRGATSAGGAVRCALSAGRDTRVMAALLRATGAPVTFYTGGDPWSADVVIGSELAERFELAHEVEAPRDRAIDWTEAARRFVRQTDGLSSLIQLHDYIELTSPVGAVNVTFWGVGGEIGRAGSGALSNVAPNLPLASRLSAVQKRLLALKLDDEGMLTSDGRALVHDFLTGYVDDRRQEGWDTREVSEAFYAFERVASWGSTGLRRATGATDLFSPFCTRPFIEHCFALRPGQRYVEATHHDLLATLDPALLAHRFEVPFRSRHWRLSGFSAARQLWNTARQRQRHGVSPEGGEPSFLDQWLDGHRRLLQMLAGEAPPSLWSIVDRERFESQLTADQSGPAGVNDVLLRIATLLLLLEQTDVAVAPASAVETARE